MRRAGGCARGGDLCQPGTRMPGERRRRASAIADAATLSRDLDLKRTLRRLHTTPPKRDLAAGAGGASKLQTPRPRSSSATDLAPSGAGVPGADAMTAVQCRKTHARQIPSRSVKSDTARDEL